MESMIWIHIQCISQNTLPSREYILDRVIITNESLKHTLDITRFFYIRNRFIRNQGSARQKIEKLQGWIRGDLRNFQIEKNRK